jgi:acetyl-CoA carboxylase biotin carboxyl carrier protein
MKISFLKKLIEIVESSEIEELEVKRWWTRVRITKSRRGGSGTNSNGTLEMQVSNPGLAQAVQPGEAQPQPAVEQENLVEIKSPMVGTFYRAPSPDAKPYVEVGERVEAGQVVCIIEAMKLMNEIESDVSGRIVKVPAENAQPVEFGQALFLVSPS